VVNLEPLLSLLPYLLLNHTVLPFLLNLNSLWRILRVCGSRILNIIVAFENASRPKKKTRSSVKNEWFLVSRHQLSSHLLLDVKSWARKIANTKPSTVRNYWQICRISGRTWKYFPNVAIPGSNFELVLKWNLSTDPTFNPLATAYKRDKIAKGGWFDGNTLISGWFFFSSNLVENRGSIVL
jgi:hypothetical protein